MSLNILEATIDGNWSLWSEWTKCSATCKGGRKSRSRVCDSPSPSGGGKNCSGPSSEIKICNIKKCTRKYFHQHYFVGDRSKFEHNMSWLVISSYDLKVIAAIQTMEGLIGIGARASIIKVCRTVVITMMKISNQAHCAANVEVVKLVTVC